MTRRALLAFAFLAAAAPAFAQTSWGVVATVTNEIVFCDPQRDRVWKLDTAGHLTVVLPNTHCRGAALGADGAVYGESVSGGTAIDASARTSRDATVGVWRLGADGIVRWIEPPTLRPDPSIWIVVDREGRSYGWNGALPRSALSQVVRREPTGAVAIIAGGRWGQADGFGDRAMFGRVTGLALAPDGTLLVADSGNLRRVTEQQEVRTESRGTISDPAAGLVGQAGLWDRTIGLVAALDGSAIVVDEPGRRITHIGRDGSTREVWRSRGWANAVSGSRWGWRPTGIAVLQSGFYVMEDWAMPTLAADLIGTPRITLVRPDGSIQRVVSVSSWLVRLLTGLTLVIVVSAIQASRRRPRR